MILDLAQPLTLFDMRPGVMFATIGMDALAMIDSTDSDLLRYRWHASGPYAAGTVGEKSVLMHRLIMARVLGQDIAPEILVDHANGDALDNRRENLRLANRYQNAQNQKRHSNNTSGYRGVTRYRDRWQARISAYGRRIHLGYHDTPESAYSAYCEAARVHHGAFARLEIFDIQPSPVTVGGFEKVA